MAAVIYDLDHCKKVYKNLFSIEIDISGVNKHNDMWPIIVHRDINLRRLLNLVGHFDDLVSAVKFPYPEKKHNRFGESYVVWVKPEYNVSTYMNRSLSEVDEMGVLGVSLVEYYLLCIFVRSNFGQSLDSKTRTLCSGSRNENNESLNLMSCNRSINASPHEKYEQKVGNMGTREVFYYQKIER